MQNLFRAKRKSFRILSRLWYIIFLLVGFGIGLTIGLTVNNLNLIEYIKNIASEVVK